jgi:hypothetical protein
MDPNKRQAIADRIRALLSKTVANGCTEDEAVAAAEKAAELLTLYDLSMDEVEMRASPFSGADQDHDSDDVGERFWVVAKAISELTSTRSWTSRPGVRPVCHSFFGIAHEVEIAGYLLDICSRAVRSEVERAAVEGEWALFRLAIRRSRRIAFLDGMCDRLAERIRALRPPRPKGAGLVVLRNALISEEMERRNLKLDTGKPRDSRDFDPSYSQGVAAADTVALDPGIGPPDRISGVIGVD